MQAKTTPGWVFGAQQASRRLLAAALVAALVIGLGACGSGSESAPAPPDYKQALKGAPPKLAALYAKGDQVLQGDSSDVQARLDGLRGYPVVMNAWGSWCGPCREEFPIFQKASAQFGAKVGFLGLDTMDAEAAAKTFLDERPLPYPSYTDTGSDLADEFTPGVRGLPKTAFYDSSGERVFVHQGPYTSVDQLEADIKHYAE
jgi:cytochrome c biogenesis protein CcmG, thiol:disulfide interchange protein DsbE